MLTNIVKMLSGLKGYLAVALITSTVAALGSWTARGWREDARYNALALTQAQARADSAEKALKRLDSNITALADASQKAAEAGPRLSAEIKKLTGALKNAPPLPPNCRPDSVRMRSLADSVRAVNAASAQH